MNWIKFFISIALCQLAGVVGSVFTMSAIPTWYATLKKPFFSPPNWLFGPAWITLYALMGVSFYRIWRLGWSNTQVKTAMIVFLIQLALNAVWSIIFFGLKNPGLAFAEIVILWIFIAVSIYLFYRLDKTAAYLLVPYLLWVSFASVLNFSIWKLN